MTSIEMVIASYAIVFVGFALLYAIALPISLALESVSKRITRKRELAYRLANQCKGITKKGEQCLKWNDCPHHSN
jgi:hypothetical protein